MTPSSTRRRLAAIAIAVAIVAVLGACGSDGDGPLKPSRPTTTAVGSLGITETQRNFHVSVDIHRPGSTIKVLDVQALTSPNVEYLGAVTVWPRDLPGVNIGFGPKYPPPKAKAVHELGEEIPAAETLIAVKPFTQPPPVNVVAGFRLLDGDIGAMNGVKVTYEADGKKSTDTWTVAAIACSMTCQESKESEDPDFEKRTLSEAGLLPKD